MMDLRTHTSVLSRRTLITGAIAGASTTALLAARPARADGNPAPTTIHRFGRDVPFPLNAYIVEGEDGLVVVDAMLTNTASRELRQQVDAIAKPVRAVFLTHPHPDHYAGIANLTEGLDVPIVSTSGVNDVARRDDEDKNALIGGMFGDEWPANRVFPNDIAGDGDTLDFGPGLRFTVIDIGPAESFHDSIFILEGPARTAFAGDIVYPFVHSYMADGTNSEWKRAIDRLQAELPEDMILHVGHGAPVTPAFLAWQEAYLDRFEAALLAADWSDADAAQEQVAEDMMAFLPSEELLFFMQLSIQPNAQRLGLLE